MANAFVYVIESPADTDLLDGRTEGRALCEALSLANVPHWYSLVTTSKTFAESLGTRLSQAVSHFQSFPILHLSMHGNDKGVALTNGDFLTWENLRKYLAPLTNGMQGGLLICISSCLSSFGCRMAMHEDNDQPFWALVGNDGSPSWSDAAVAYITFYHLRFKNVPLQQCVERMRTASGDENFRVVFGHQVKADWEALRQKERPLEALLAALQSYSSANSGTLSGLFGQAR
jgi:hypothetical protein